MNGFAVQIASAEGISTMDDSAYKKPSNTPKMHKNTRIFDLNLHILKKCVNFAS